MEFGLKWVYMAGYELIRRLDRALWLTIVFKPLLTPKRATHIPKNAKIYQRALERQGLIGKGFLGSKFLNFQRHLARYQQH